MENSQNKIENMLEQIGCETLPENIKPVAQKNVTTFLENNSCQSGDSIIIKIATGNLIKYAAAAVIVIGFLFGLSRYPFFFDGSTTVWADVAQKCRNLKTISFISEHNTGRGSINQGRLDIEQTDYFYAYGKYKEISKLGSSRREEYIILNERYIDENKQVTFIDHAARQCFKGSLPEKSVSALDFIAYFKTLPSKADKIIGHRIIEQQNTTGFMVIGHGIDMKIWVNEETSNPVLVEVLWTDSSMAIIYSNFRFDLEMDSSLFDVRIPDGYSESNWPTSKPGGQGGIDDLVYYLKLYATYSKDSHFPDAISISRDKDGHFKSVSLQAISADKCTESEKKEMSIKGPGCYHFLGQMKPENDWHYTGKGVRLGDVNSVILWFRPDNSETYKIIYGDLIVKDILPKDLPE